MRSLALLLLLCSLPAQADVNTPTDPLAPLLNMQIQHERGSPTALLRWTKTDSTRYCQKVQFADFNAAMNNWYSNTGLSFVPVMDWYLRVSFALPALTISQEENDRCWKNWK